MALRVDRARSENALRTGWTIEAAAAASSASGRADRVGPSRGRGEARSAVAAVEQQAAERERQLAKDASGREAEVGRSSGRHAELREREHGGGPVGEGRP